MVFGVWWDFGAWGLSGHLLAVWELGWWRCGYGMVVGIGKGTVTGVYFGRFWSNGVSAHGPRERRRFEVVI